MSQSIRDHYLSSPLFGANAPYVEDLYEAYQRDPELYGFLRRLEALKRIGDVNTTLILDTKTPPFDALRMPVGGKAPKPAQAPAEAASRQE